MNKNNGFWAMFGFTAIIAFIVQIMGLCLVGFALWMIGRYFHVV